MKRIALLLGLLVTAGAFAQESPSFEYNKWSVDLGAGMNKPVRPMKTGYSSKTPDFFTGHVGVRYMFNDKFGLRANVQFNKFDDASKSLPFKSEMYSYGIDGVVNLGNVLGFNSWTNTIGLLGHAGVSYSTLKGKKPVKSSTDEMATVSLGLTPQVRLGNRVALFVDASLNGNMKQDLTFDGQGTTSTRGMNGYFFTTTAGVNIYLGKHGKHADWYAANDNVQGELEKLHNRVAQLENDFKNFDNETFELPSYLTQGSLDNRYLDTNAASGEAMKELLSKGYVNVFFDFDKTNIQEWSTQWIHYAYQYLADNPSAKITLYGYADELGNNSYNEKLSERRANKVKDILVALGIDASRISTEGKGIDSSVDKNDAEARKFMRRVNFKLN